MKINKAYPIKELMDTINEYIKLTNRRVTFEYIMLEDINDSEKEAKEYVVLEDYTGQNYYEIKGKLEAKGIKVEMKTKSVENASEYKDKKDNIISQEPAFNKDEETKLYANDLSLIHI